MNADLDTILDAAMKLPSADRQVLVSLLSASNIRVKTPGAVRKHFGAISSGDPHSADNGRIDEDLAREYLDTHEFEN